MLRNILNPVVFLAGLLAVCWIGVGYLGSNPLGLAVTLVIGLCYATGALELHRYRQATATLVHALADTAAAQNNLGDWLDRLHPGLRSPVRLRIEGERTALPAPALTPYLVGLLVLLGMLGTLLGMMATLSGTGLALESATDLEAIRGSLGAPVKGLAFAFGTSIAGVASSAMLGLLSALCRRERLQTVQRLDAQIATSLRSHSHAYQREQTFLLMQQQTSLMPTLVERLQAMMATLEQQQQVAGEQLQAGQQEFHARADAAQARLAASLEQSLKAGVVESAQAVASALQPLVETTLAGLAREAASVHASVDRAVQQQLHALDAGFQNSTTAAAASWNAAVAEQQRSNGELAQDLRRSLEQFADTFEQRSSGLLEAVSTRLDASAEHTADAWDGALSRQEALNAQLAARNEQALAAAAAAFEDRATSLVGVMQQAHTGLQAALEAGDRQRLAQWSDAFAATTAALAANWERSGEQVAQRQQDICDTLARTAGEMSAQVQAQARDTIAGMSDTAQALSAAAGSFEERTATLLDTMQQSHGELQAALEARDQQRLAQWSDAFAATTAALAANWERSGEQVAQRQQDICDTLARTAQEITAQAQAHAGETIAEISRLVQVASEAPKAAAEVVAELRQKLSESMVRDTAMLEERSRLLATLETLLDAVNHASTEQRTAVDALVGTSADLLERVGTRFTDHVEAETGKLGSVAAQVASGAIEVASLGEAFAAAVQLFGQSTDALNERLLAIESALEKSLTRSDEQLAYYVAQAREVVDLSLLSQKQIIGELQQLAGREASVGAETA